MDRINKFLAHAGVGSRRHCDTLILAGRVKINDIVVTDMSTRVDPTRHKVFVDDHPVKTEKPLENSSSIVSTMTKSRMDSVRSMSLLK